MTPRFSCAALVAFAFLSATAPGQTGSIPDDPVQLKDANDLKYRVGDVWEYHTRPGEKRSRFVVLKVETSPKLGTIVHIGVDNLAWKNCQGDGLNQSVPHMPFSRSAIDASTVRRVTSGSQLPSYREGYEVWRDAFLQRRAGIYSIPLKEAVAVAEKTWRTGIGCGLSVR